MGGLFFIDSEIGTSDRKIKDLGALAENGAWFHSPDIGAFVRFLHGARFLCGHNIVDFDLKRLGPALRRLDGALKIDTLYLSALLFPGKASHALSKDEKLDDEELNNPLSDCKKARALFYEEIEAFRRLSGAMKEIYWGLLARFEQFHGFFEYLGLGRSGWAHPRTGSLVRLVRDRFSGRICSNADLEGMARRQPMELAYALSFIQTLGDKEAGSPPLPPWLLRNLPRVENVVSLLRNSPCRKTDCPYCSRRFDARRRLRDYFGYDSFRVFNGEHIQEDAVIRALEGASLLAVFPTGGGKSLAFQLPALIAGETAQGLTVVISPLQALMKDQVDNLNKSGIAQAVTVNGLLDPIERRQSYESVRNGAASLLYISPEMLRSRTIEKMLLDRNVSRFVVDEAHCLSAWGQDFRVDYLFIGKFIKRLEEAKGGFRKIPVSCFTATAKQKVVSDICDYFRGELGLILEKVVSNAARENLRYTVLREDTDEDKYRALRALVQKSQCPSIVYVSRTKQAENLAGRLSDDGIPALPFHGKMDPAEKVRNQNLFMSNEVQAMVATSAFGMGVDKSDIGLVVHYDIADSLENYIQEAGRAGRDPNLNADCYILFNENDLNKHFTMLNQTKLSLGEIQQVWRAVKRMTAGRGSVCRSPLEIARAAGWSDTAPDIETRVRAAIAALENAGYIERGRNVARIYATGIQVDNMRRAVERIDSSKLLDDGLKTDCKRIIKSLITERSVSKADRDAEAESRVDYLADILGLELSRVTTCVDLMRQDGLLADTMDMKAWVGRNVQTSLLRLKKMAELEKLVLGKLSGDGRAMERRDWSLKALNEEALNSGIKRSSVQDLRLVLYYLTIKKEIGCRGCKESSWIQIEPKIEPEEIESRSDRRLDLCRWIVDHLRSKADAQAAARQEAAARDPSEKRLVSFSLVGLLNERNTQGSLYHASLEDVQDALLYLSKAEIIAIEGGFLVFYSPMEIRNISSSNRISYKKDDYRRLDEFYKQRIQQIHIVGEFANMMLEDYDAAMGYVKDYFEMDHRRFIDKYFKGERKTEIERNITPARYRQIFGGLSPVQRQIIDDKDRFIAVAAGPGSGKTHVLVRKLASLIMLEDVKAEQLLMLTLTRAAATEFKERLKQMVGSAAAYVEIRTFHSYSFDLLGRPGNIDESGTVVRQAVQRIREGGVEAERLTKSVLVLDEAQDMDGDALDLVKELMRFNEEMRVVAVGDDDQNIFEFRGSSSKHFLSFVREYAGGKRYEMLENFRSKPAIVGFANNFVKRRRGRLKTGDIVSAFPDGGLVELVRHPGGHMESALVENLSRNLPSDKQATVCVLTQNNDEALTIHCLLAKTGIPAKLVQSDNNFKFGDLLEVRAFLKYLEATDEEPAADAQADDDPETAHAPTISLRRWKQAKRRLEEKYKRSACLENCLNMAQKFENTHEIMFRSDLEEFIKESKYEDFHPEKKGEVYVSTIHKAKGKEFDKVYMLLDMASTGKDEEIRKLYVGMTRARNELHIHCNNDLFDDVDARGGTKLVRIARPCPEPEEIVLQAGLHDVVLDFFKDKKLDIFQLRSGDPLSLQDAWLWARIGQTSKPVAVFSKKMRENLDRKRQQGYQPDGAQVSFIVAWKPKDAPEDEKESAVLLPAIHLRKAAAAPPAEPRRFFKNSRI